MPEKPVKLAIIGCGGIANAHLRGYQTLIEKGVDTFSIDATCDVRKESAVDFSNKIAAFQGSAPRVYADVEEMLKAENLNAADICTSHSHHHITAIPCLESGVNIMTEKPFGINLIIGNFPKTLRKKIAIFPQIEEFVKKAMLHGFFCIIHAT